jgi:hypothetical protein
MDKSTQNRRIFFENYTKIHGFDLLISENWYFVTNTSVKSVLVFSLLIILNNINNILINLYRREQKVL